MISLNIVVFHVAGDERINVVVLLVLKKSGYDSGASFSFLTLITSPGNSTRGCGFITALDILSAIPRLDFAETSVTFPNVNPL
jgi:hypothetical protein